MTIDLNQTLLYASAVVGAATALITAMSSFIVPLRDLAKLTKMTTDDEWVERLNTWLHAALQGLLTVGKALAPLALKNPLRVFPPSPVIATAQTSILPPPAAFAGEPFTDADDEKTTYR